MVGPVGGGGRLRRLAELERRSRRAARRRRAASGRARRRRPERLGAPGALGSALGSKASDRRGLGGAEPRSRRAARARPQAAAGAGGGGRGGGAARAVAEAEFDVLPEPLQLVLEPALRRSPAPRCGRWPAAAASSSRLTRRTSAAVWSSSWACGAGTSGGVGVRWRGLVLWRRKKSKPCAQAGATSARGEEDRAERRRWERFTTGLAWRRDSAGARRNARQASRPGAVNSPARRSAQ